MVFNVLKRALNVQHISRLPVCFHSKEAASFVNKKYIHSSSVYAAMKAKVKGLDINYETAGEGDQVLLCLPGALGSIQTDFGPQLKQLPGPDLKLVVWDPPGYGESIPPNRDFPLDYLHRDADLAAQLMKELGHKRYSILGWSDGGISSLILAARNPDQIQKMIVYGASAYITKQEVDFIKTIRDVSNWSDRMRAPMEKLYGAEYFKTSWEKFVDGLADILKEKDGDFCTTELKNINCPTLIFHGKKDPMVIEEHAYYLEKNVKGAILEIWEEGKHNMHLRYHEKFNQRCKEFLCQ